jgi:hypothetical protein
VITSPCRRGSWRSTIVPTGSTIESEPVHHKTQNSEKGIDVEKLVSVSAVAVPVFTE